MVGEMKGERAAGEAEEGGRKEWQNSFKSDSRSTRVP